MARFSSAIVTRFYRLSRAQTRHADGQRIQTIEFLPWVNLYLDDPGEQEGQYLMPYAGAPTNFADIGGHNPEVLKASELTAVDINPRHSVGEPPGPNTVHRFGFV